MSVAYEFGPYRLDRDKRLLTRDGQGVTLAPKTYELLLLLVRSGGKALSKQELMTALWPDTFVEEANLSFQVTALRKALGEEWIETVPRHGYRFPAAVSKVPDTDASPATPRGSRWVALVAVVSTAAALLFAALYFRPASRSISARAWVSRLRITTGTAAWMFSSPMTPSRISCSTTKGTARFRK